MNIKKNRYALLKIHKEQFNKYVFIFFLHFFFFLTLDLQASHQEALLYSTEHLRTLTHHPAVESRLGFSVLPKDSWSPGSNRRPSNSRAACSTAPPVFCKLFFLSSTGQQSFSTIGLLYSSCTSNLNHKNV